MIWFRCLVQSKEKKECLRDGSYLYKGVPVVQLVTEATIDCSIVFWKTQELWLYEVDPNDIKVPS